MRESQEWARGDGEMGRWGDGEMGRWGDGEMGRWGDGESDKQLELQERAPSLLPAPCSLSHYW
ncbi:MAG: hypothetical protein F6J98_00370 [Moorea sp. SIO4G2]|nr:hypothetical protein [Moorena sp. SIO4G2]